MKGKKVVKPSNKKKSTQTAEAPTLIAWRFRLILGCVLLIFTALVARIGYIQVIEPDNLIKQRRFTFGSR